jgi:hypothetical protein
MRVCQVVTGEFIIFADTKQNTVPQPLTIFPTTPYVNRLSLQANLKNYVWLVEVYMDEGNNLLTVINERLADSIVGINGKLDFANKFVRNLLL